MAKINNKLLILVVGDIDQWIASGRDLPRIAQTRFCAFSELTAVLLAELQPDIILCPLLAENFDVLDIVAVLDFFEFPGRIRALAPPFPNPEIITREVKVEFPSLDFDIIEVRPGPKLRTL